MQSSTESERVTTMKRTSWRVAGILAAGLIVLAATRTSSAQTATETWQVEIDIYSGRPNPVLTLTANELADVKNRLAAAAPVPAADANAASIRPSRLGYRGLIIRGKSGDGKTTTADIELFAGRILRRAPSARAVLDDRSVGLERMLVGLANAKQMIPAGMMKEIQKVMP